MKNLCKSLALLGAFIVSLSSVGQAADGVAGTYRLNPDDLIKMVIEQAKNNGASEVEIQQATAMIQSMASAIKMEIKLNADGTFNASMSMMGESSTASGTYSISDGKIHITTTHEDGVAKDEPDTNSADYANGSILIMEPGMPFPMALSKKEE